MKITAKTRYGMRALIFIIEEQNRGCELIRIKDISENQKITIQYLEQILYKLKKAGMVSGKRGPNGGYKVVKDASEIKVSEIFEILESNMKIVDCSKNIKNCMKDDCTTSYLWNKLEKNISKVLNETTIKEIMDDNLKKKSKE